MSTVGYLLVLSALILMRQVSKGRALDLSTDLSDAFLAFVQGDVKGLNDVLKRTGSGNSPTNPEIGSAAQNVIAAGGQLIKNAELVNAAVELGSKAKGYKWAATGPDYYDCSGLMWRACQKLGFKGPRFTTADVMRAEGMEKISGPSIGALVVWPSGSTGHMGVVSGENEFYSARSVKSGIGYSKISTFRDDSPIYLRYNSWLKK